MANANGTVEPFEVYVVLNFSDTAPLITDIVDCWVQSILGPRGTTECCDYSRALKEEHGRSAFIKCLRNPSAAFSSAARHLPACTREAFYKDRVCVIPFTFQGYLFARLSSSLNVNSIEDATDAQIVAVACELMLIDLSSHRMDAFVFNIPHDGVMATCHLDVVDSCFLPLDCTGKHFVLFAKFCNYLLQDDVDGSSSTGEKVEISSCGYDHPNKIKSYCFYVTYVTFLKLEVRFRERRSLYPIPENLTFCGPPRLSEIDVCIHTDDERLPPELIFRTPKPFHSEHIVIEQGWRVPGDNNKERRFTVDLCDAPEVECCLLAYISDKDDNSCGSQNVPTTC